jgi:S1-C subfamily serine protease
MDSTKVKIWSGIKQDLLYAVIAGVCGGLAGGAAGFYASADVIGYQVPDSLTVATTTLPAEPDAKPTSTISLIQVERPALASVVPPAFLKRRASSIATLYRAPKAGTLDERILDEERMLGQTVALTSDGWFVTSAENLAGLKLADLAVWYGEASYPVTKGFIDKVNSTAYLKTDVRDIQAATFSNIRYLTRGSEVWTELRQGEMAPMVVLNLGGRVATEGPVSSEIAARRIILSGAAWQNDRGGGVWDMSGQLVGIVESKAGAGLRVIPSTSLVSSLSSLLQAGEIRHAALGVRALDLGTIRLSGPRDDLPPNGALIHDDKITGKAGIVKESPAAKAGLKAGDVILKVERDILDGTGDLGEILSEYQPGSTVTLRVLRGQTDTDVKVELGSAVTSEALK